MLHNTQTIVHRPLQILAYKCKRGRPHFEDALFCIYRIPPDQ